MALHGKNNEMMRVLAGEPALSLVTARGGDYKHKQILVLPEVGVLLYTNQPKI